MDSKQRHYPVEGLNSGYGAYTQESNNNNGLQTNTQSSSYFGLQKPSDNIPSIMSEGSVKKPLVSGTDTKGFQYRSPEIGRVIPQEEIINKIVPYWELFVSNTGLFGYHIITKAVSNIGTKNAMDTLFFNGCNSENAQSNLDVCTTSILSWSIVGGSLLYLAFSSTLAGLLFVECKRKGYPGTFTALWNSPLFLLCYFFKEENRINLLTIPNKFVGFKKWTRLNMHRLGLAIYSFITTVIIIYYFSTNKTVDRDDFMAQKQYKSGDAFYRIYNPYYLPYYVAVYFYVKAIIYSVIEIKNSNFDQAELVGINYNSLKH